MENQIQARDKRQGNSMTPPRTVMVTRFKGKPRRVRIDADSFNPKLHGEIVPNSERQYFESEVAAFSDELHQRAHASDQHRRATGVTGDAKTL